MRIWVGYHDRIGVVFYDPSNQIGIDSANVLLWVVNNHKLRLFQKSVVRQHLLSLERYLLASGLASLLQQHGIVQQVAKRYLTSHTVYAFNLLSNFKNLASPDQSDALQESEHDEHQLLNIELNEDQDAWARSEEEGWFYG